MTFTAALYDPNRHDATAFDCGEDSLNSWLQDQASTSTARGTAATWVWVDKGRVVAYYSLASHRVRGDDLPKALSRGGPAEIPAVLIGKLALDNSLHGQGMGNALLGDALNRIVVATRMVAARVIVVDALNESVADFYARYGFKRVPGTLRLVLKVSTAAAAYDLLHPKVP